MQLKPWLPLTGGLIIAGCFAAGAAQSDSDSAAAQREDSEKSEMRQAFDRLDLEAHVRLRVQPYAASIPAHGVVVAKYHLPVENSNGEVFEALIGYDLFTRAWFKVHGWDGKAYIMDPDGRKQRGDFLDPESFEVTRLDDLPLDDSLVEAFFPQVFLRDVASRPEIFREVRQRMAPRPMPNGEMREVRTGGVIATVALPFGRRYGDRLSEAPAADLPHEPVTFEVDKFGRLVRIEKPGVVREFSYGGEGPEGFPLADPAHGGNWRLAEWAFLEDLDAEAVFTPVYVSALAQEWGVAAEDVRR